MRWMMLAALLTACARSGDGSGDAESTQPPGSATQAASASPESARTPAAPPAAPVAADTGVTPWHPLEFPSEPWAQTEENPRALLERVRDLAAAQLEEPDASVLPTRMESESADSAVGLLTHPNLADDSIRDIEFRIHMRREGSAWTVAGVQRRERCRRGVAPDGVCA